jgi:XTP/dITP diphosphohydrolase
MELIYATSSDVKFEIAASVLRDTGIRLIQNKIELPEIQSTSVEEVARFSCEWARDKLNCAVVVTDAGFYINALNGFPGPYVKYVNGWLTAEDIIRLLEGKKDRTVQIKECLAFCKMGCDPVVFLKTMHGVISKEIKSDKGSIIDQLVIPENCDFALSELSDDQVVPFWSKRSAFNSFKEWLTYLN